MESFSVKKVIWAMDVFTGTPEADQLTAKTLSSFFFKMEIQPKIFPVNVFPGISKDDSFPTVEKEIKKRLSRLDIPGLQPVTVIAENMAYMPMVHDQVKDLLRFAENLQCDLLVLTIHAHEVSERPLLGSFANELLSQSSIPLLLIGSSCRFENDMQKILLPMSVDEIGKEEGDRVLDVLSRLKTEPVVYYHIHDNVSRRFPPENIVRKLLKPQLQRTEKHVESLRNRLQTMIGSRISGVKVTVEKNSRSFDDSILDYAEKNRFDLTLFSSDKSQIHRRFPDHMIRHVAEKANCPVLILR